MIVAEGHPVHAQAVTPLRLQWGRNMIVAEGLVLDEFCATLDRLQWGRNMIVAEGLGPRCYQARRILLQWGRNMIVAEGHLRGHRQDQPDHASMGPQHDSCGRTGGLLGGFTRLQELQWGRNMIVAEGTKLRRGRVRGTRCFNGAAT